MRIKCASGVSLFPTCPTAELQGGERHVHLCSVNNDENMSTQLLFEGNTYNGWYS